MPSQHSIESMTAIQAQEYLTGRSGTFAFNQIVLLVTTDSVFWCSSAKYEHLGRYHYVWTEHHGDFFYHDDEVAKVHVTSAVISALAKKHEKS